VTNPTDWKEIIAPDEEARFARYAEQIGELQRKRDEGAAKRSRALHARQLVGARAEFVVPLNVSDAARVGIFAHPATYPAWVRFSNGAAVHQSDRRGDIRGMAIKVLGVPGRKLIDGLEQARTQDFLMIQSPVLPFRNSDEFMFFVGAAANPRTLPFKMLRRFGLRRMLRIAGVSKIFSKFIPTLAAQRFWTPVPIRWGDRAAKYSVSPASPVSAPSASKSPTYLADEIAERLSREAVTYDFRVQFFVDEARTPIEDASVEWPESVSPFETVARLVIPQQDVRSEEGAAREASIERMSFDPWHAPEEFRPLGDVMRARKSAYYVSVKGRNAADEPTDASFE